MTISVVIENSQVKFKDCSVGLLVYNNKLCMKTETDLTYMVDNGRIINIPNDEMVNACYCEGGSNRVMPDGETRKDRDGWTYNSHPSYALISFNRETSSKGTALFGSSIKHRNPIRLVISHADVSRGLNNDWYHDRGRIVEIEMSQSQFAEAITSFGYGVGVPCTLVFTERDGRIPQSNYISKTEQFSNEFQEQISGVESKLSDCLKEVREIFETKKNLNKSDRERILSILSKAKADVSNNAAFVYDSFAEQMDKTVKEAKGEIESFMQNKRWELAGMALAGDIPKGLECIDETKNPVEIE